MRLGVPAVCKKHLSRQLDSTKLANSQDNVQHVSGSRSGRDPMGMMINALHGFRRQCKAAKARTSWLWADKLAERLADAPTPLHVDRVELGERLTRNAIRQGIPTPKSRPG